jgi:hypothetical protein
MLTCEAPQILVMKSAEPCARRALLGAQRALPYSQRALPCAQRALIRTRCVDLRSFVLRDGQELS